MEAIPPPWGDGRPHADMANTVDFPLKLVVCC